MNARTPVSEIDVKPMPCAFNEQRFRIDGRHTLQRKCFVERAGTALPSFRGRTVNMAGTQFSAADGLPGVRLLERAVARFAARIVDRHPCGDHRLFIGVEYWSFRSSRRRLMFFGGRYACVAADRC